MKRIFPAPVLSVAIFVLWLVLNQSLEPGQALLGLLVAVLAPLLSAPLRPVPVRIRHPLTVLRLTFDVLHDVAVSNVQVAHRIATQRWRAPHAMFVTVPLELRDPNGLAVLAIITTVVPGTIWSELAVDGNQVLLHVFDVDDAAAFIGHFKDRYEKPLREIFE